MKLMLHTTDNTTTITTNTTSTTITITTTTTTTTVLLYYYYYYYYLFGPSIVNYACILTMCVIINAQDDRQLLHVRIIMQLHVPLIHDR